MFKITLGTVCQGTLCCHFHKFDFNEIMKCAFGFGICIIDSDVEYI